MSSTSDAQQKVTDFIDRNKAVAEKNVTEKFPLKVEELDKFLASDILCISRLTQIASDTGIPKPAPIPAIDAADVNGVVAKKRKLPDDVGEVTGTKVYAFACGSVVCNPYIVELIDKIKPKIMDLMDSANSIKMWIQMNIPRIEDGNNFGVSIQEEALAEARQVEGDAATYLDALTRYFVHRAKLCAKLAKYPHLDDYRRAVQELDEKEFITLRLVCAELRNHYAGLHDIIMKNLDKIKRPRTQNTHNMY
ncbi:proteasome activator complex subunit 3-like isoform X1 [Watersipora subatra]|uniref:proteasome activator complex subunit 3-like isoform X1 n=1 Tax=Watersipora subatra TaxID=2589382 RepID=UPI00355B0706